MQRVRNGCVMCINLNRKACLAGYFAGKVETEMFYLRKTKTAGWTLVGANCVAENCCELVVLIGP